MSISWDENQLTALSSWVAEKLPLEKGEMAVVTMDMPPNCFAGTVNLPEKLFTVFANPEASLADITVNVLLGYIVALAYDRSGWDGVPSQDVLLDCHRLVCQSLLDFNEDFSKVLEEHVGILDSWHEHHVDDSTTTEPVDANVLVDSMGQMLFAANPADTKKNYGSN